MKICSIFIIEFRPFLQFELARAAIVSNFSLLLCFVKWSPEKCQMKSCQTRQSQSPLSVSDNNNNKRSEEQVHPLEYHIKRNFEKVKASPTFLFVVELILPCIHF